MTQLFRAMKEDAAGSPELGPGGRSLGVRPGIDVPATAPDDVVLPAQGGVSVSPGDPSQLPRHRRPPELGGTGRDPVWTITEADLDPALAYRPDPNHAGHGFIEPAAPMTLTEFDKALERTQARWHKLQSSSGTQGTSNGT